MRATFWPRLLGGLSALVLIASPVGASAPAADATYEITIHNSTTGQPFTPVAAATHDSGFDLFSLQNPATVAIQQIAENGDLHWALGAFASSASVHDHTVGFGPGQPPVVRPGESATFSITGAPGGLVSAAAMLICTNDGFTGVDSVRLPRGLDNSVSYDLNAYDAGTELNTEGWDDLVPPCALLTGFGDQGGTGATDPALAEQGVVTMHTGIAGTADLDPGLHGWEGPVGTITITRTG